MAEHADDTSLIQPTANTMAVGSTMGFVKLVRKICTWAITTATWLLTWGNTIFTWTGPKVLGVLSLYLVPMSLVGIWSGMLQLPLLLTTLLG